MTDDAHRRLMAEVDAFPAGEQTFETFSTRFDELFVWGLDVDSMTQGEFDFVASIHERLGLTSDAEPDAESRRYGYISPR